MKISFHGAARGVTGSCHLLESGGTKILVDCGLYQGGRELDEDNAESFGFDPSEIDFVLLTHAHLDHCGRLPLLVKRGFKGEIITTAATKELTRIVLLDSAHLQEEEARYKAKKAKHLGGQAVPEALYSLLDALNTLEYFGRSAGYKETMQLTPEVQATFYDAGHILGSASVYLELQENGRKITLVFSGDLGNAGRPLLRTPHVPHKADIVVMETTYGDRLHKDLPDSIEEMYTAIKDTFQRGGNVIIPTFALERAQELLYYLREGVLNKQLPESMQVFLDSPMAISATEIFKRHPECYSAEVAELFRTGHDPFNLPGLHFTRDTDDSMSINQITGGAVIMAGSGMCTGGRVRHHLQHNLGRNNASIVFVGFAAKQTLARYIIDGAKTVNLFGKEVPVRARIYTINGFSAHADQAELLAWHREIAAEMTFLVHGDDEVMQAFAPLLMDSKVEMPTLHQVFEI